MSALRPHILLERKLVVSPLGIRFWDAATESQVTEGLMVTARPAAGGGTRHFSATAFRTVSGIYAFRDLPGLESVERPSEIRPAPHLPTSIPEPQPFLVDVQDRLERFVPVVFEVDLPLAERGVFPFSPGTGLPDGPVPGFYLFSSSARRPSSGMAAVRASLIDETTRAAAAHAVLEIDVNGQQWLSVADENGRAAVLFPYPPLTITLSGSFPEGGTSLHEYEWPVTARVRYEPAILDPPAGSRLPTLQNILAQESGGFYADDPDASIAASPVDAMAATLRFGEDGVLRTQNRSELLVRPATSIP